MSKLKNDHNRLGLENLSVEEASIFSARYFRCVKNTVQANDSGRRFASVTGHQVGELLGWDNLTADKPSAEIVIIYRRASTSMYVELSSTFTPYHKNLSNCQVILK